MVAVRGGEERTTNPWKGREGIETIVLRGPVHNTVLFVETQFYHAQLVTLYYSTAINQLFLVHKIYFL